jgi:hypothetical protein
MMRTDLKIKQTSFLARMREDVVITLLLRHIHPCLQLGFVLALIQILNEKFHNCGIILG